MAQVQSGKVRMYCAVCCFVFLLRYGNQVESEKKQIKADKICCQSSCISI